MFNLITFLFTLFWTSSPNHISALYNVELEAIVISGFNSKEKASHYEVAVYIGEVSVSFDKLRVIGNSNYEGSQIYYKPKYGFSAGAFYTVVITSKGFHNEKAKGSFRLVVKIPKTEVNATTYVKAVYPTVSKLPMNQLKLYIEFSSPMTLGNAFNHIRLYRLPKEKLEPDAFLIMPDELWDEQRKRLTIYFDPGRIKRGLQPNIQLGLPLVEGHKYKLVIDKGWLDINNAMLTDGYEKTFEVVAVDRTSPNKEDWAIAIPERGTKNPIVIDFKESMDYGLMQSVVVIVDANNQPLEGEIRLNNHESNWLFIPNNSWAEGDYKIVIDSWLEDLAGNSLRRKFDIDLTNPLDIPDNIKEVIIPFKIN